MASTVLLAIAAIAVAVLAISSFGSLERARRQPRKARSDIRFYKGKLEELERDFENRNIDVGQFQKEKLLLQKQLLRFVERQGASSDQHTSRVRQA